ncbi:universal stress protein [Luteibacter sahnii]|uniref:universal stress protein n=1 Tax=Luteibacter sahnii TaxID=3021977 RepID=UPI002A6A1CEA|nr:universal stress protein [Luteibacter sp. PPL193]MDY1546956.1 hypothetical protein [Luteibacter sp. PPL193]
MFQHLLTVLDHRPNAFRTTVMSMRLGQRFGARVTLVYVVHRGERDDAGASRDAVGRGDALFARARRVARRLGVACACRFAFGDGTDGMVAEMVTRLACDLVIVPRADDAGPLADVRRRRSPADVLVCP